MIDSWSRGSVAAPPAKRGIHAAFITGEHPYDVVSMTEALASMSDINWYPQSLDTFASDIGGRRQMYDVLVFYNFHQQLPTNEGEWWESGQLDVLESLGETTQGIFLLHHAILAYPEWKMWSDLTGIEERSFDVHPSATFKVHVETDHPVTAGLSDFDFTDETYVMEAADSGSVILLSTSSALSMRTIAWTRSYRAAKVLCYQSGHGETAVGTAAFRSVVQQGVEWLAAPSLAGS